MIPVVTPAEMAAVDAAAPEPVEVLIDRAGRAVALSALRLLGGSYGRRVVVLAGPGNNGADGRVGAHHLERRGVRCVVVDATDAPAVLPGADLVIDAGFGTGLGRPYTAPELAGPTPVLAVDIPSGVDGATGEILGRPLAATRTITFAALKPGLVLEPGRSLAGTVEVADIGLDVGPRRIHRLEDGDVAALVPARPPDDHKWRAGVRVIGGSPGMTGAAALAARAAQRMGAGIVQVASPGGSGAVDPREAVGTPLPADGWGAEALAGIERIGAMVIGPGLGSPAPLLDVIATVDVPMVIDGDALRPEILAAVGQAAGAAVLTPHDGEWARLGGSPDADRIGATRAFARDHGVTVVRKGPSTVVAGPDGDVRVITSGGPALASAGTGDVLAGAIGALLARGVDPLDAAAVAAHVHGAVGTALGAGLVASEVADGLAPWMRSRGVR